MNADGTVGWSSNSVSIPAEVADDFPEWVLEPNDLVINMTAQTLDDRFLGRVCRMHDRALLNQRIGRLTSDGRVSEGFVYIALRSARFTSWVARRCEGSKVKHMHWRHIADYPMPVPSAAEQDAIVAEADSWARTRKSLAAQDSALLGVRAALLGEIFGGR
jgi:type I restriction enzyme S subunit